MEKKKSKNIHNLTCLRCDKKFRSITHTKYCPECKRKNVLTKTPDVTIEEAVKLSRDEGLSYGKYVAKYNLK